jgi:hypothetical protein
VGETTEDIPAAGALIVITANCPSVGHRHRPGESLLCAGACLGLLHCHDTGFYLLIGVGLHLLHMRWPLSCKGSSLLERGSWTAKRVPWSRGRKDWHPFCVCLGRCTWNATLVVSMLTSSSGIFLPWRTCPFPGQNSLPTLAGRWRNTRTFSISRRWT